MSQYKHIYNAIDNAMRHIQQAQDCCNDVMHLDKEACGTWKKQLKEIEKQMKSCYKNVEGKHNKSKTKSNIKTASAASEQLIIEKLDEMYPDGKVSNLSNLNKKLYATISDVSQEEGKSVDQYIESLGFTCEKNKIEASLSSARKKSRLKRVASNQMIEVEKDGYKLTAQFDQYLAVEEIKEDIGNDFSDDNFYVNQNVYNTSNTDPEITKLYEAKEWEKLIDYVVDNYFY